MCRAGFRSHEKRCSSGTLATSSSAQGSTMTRLIVDITRICASELTSWPRKSGRCSKKSSRSVRRNSGETGCSRSTPTTCTPTTCTPTCDRKGIVVTDCMR
jgi:hypothetical protein